LAAEYQIAAKFLADQGRKGEPISLAPCRFVTLHAIELYLNAFLLMKGIEHKTIRALGHDLSARAERAEEAGLVFRRGTLSHLKDKSNREYLASRYSPEFPATLPQINRLTATLNDVARKVRAFTAPQPGKPVTNGGPPGKARLAKKNWKRVPFDTEELDESQALIKIFRKRGRVVATVTRYEWFEPDGHEHTGYADLATSEPRPANEIIALFKKVSASVAIDSDDLWDAAWGQLG
jgi:hypothetical protein